MRVEELKLPNTTPQFTPLTQDRFDRGVITVINESKLPKNALKRGYNITLVEDGAPRPRPGVDWYGTAPSANAIDGAAYYETAAEAVHLVVVAGGVVYRSVNDGATWSTCSLPVGATLTAGYKCDFEQAASYLYICNGHNQILRYDGTTTLVGYTALTAPAAPTPTKTGLAATTYTYRYRIAAVNAVGFTEASTAGTVQVSLQRDRWDSSNYVTVTWTAVSNALRYDIYVGTSAGEEYYLDSIPAVAVPSYLDNGSAIENTNILASDANTTTGPKVGDITYVGSRLWATRDEDNPYRAWWTGSGAYIGYFSTAYDGGYIDLLKGSAFRPVKVEEYRDGKGTNSLATVWCRSRDGRGCVFQIALESLTIGDVVITVPAAYRLPGSRGTNAPNSVVAVLNDFMYYNSQAFYNLGSRAQFLNLLSTDEASGNIRPSVLNINSAASSGIAGIYHEAQVFFSVPYAADENNQTVIYDTERKAWLPEGFSLGFERFFRYSDTAQEQHLLCWKPGDSRLSEISRSIHGDYGEAFFTELTTGLIHINPRNRFEFMWIEEGEVEFANPTSTINIELIGIERNQGFRSLKTPTIEPRTTNVGWSTGAWSSMPWTDTSVVAATYSESSIKRYFNVQRELNAYQYNVTTNSTDADYILRTLQVNGTPTEAGKPRQWRL